MAKKLFIDADDTLYNMIEVFCVQYSALSKKKVEVSDITSWNLYEILEHPFYIETILKNPNFYENLPLKGKNTSSIIEELNQQYELYIVTASHLDAITGKIKAFIRDFPFLKQNQIIFCWDKFLLKGDYLIDDAIHNIEGFKKTNRQGKTFCVNMPHNLNPNKKIDYRIDTLEEVGIYLFNKEF